MSHTLGVEMTHPVYEFVISHCFFFQIFRPRERNNKSMLNLGK